MAAHVEGTGGVTGGTGSGDGQVRNDTNMVAERGGTNTDGQNLGAQ